MDIGDTEDAEDTETVGRVLEGKKTGYRNKMIAVEDSRRAERNRVEAGAAAIGKVVRIPIGVALALEEDREVNSTYSQR